MIVKVGSVFSLPSNQCPAIYPKNGPTAKRIGIEVKIPICLIQPA